MSKNVEYRDIPNFPGYRVGDDGSVWSCWKRVGLVIHGVPPFVLSSHWHLLKPNTRATGYQTVCLYRGKTRAQCLVHRLVLEAFVGPCPSGMEACHFPDPSRANCSLTNLRWDTRSENHNDVTRGRSLPVVEKRCPRCQIVKPRSSFGNKAQKFGGVACWCFECDHKYQAETKRRRKNERLARNGG